MSLDHLPTGCFQHQHVKPVNKEHKSFPAVQIFCFGRLWNVPVPSPKLVPFKRPPALCRASVAGIFSSCENPEVLYLFLQATLPYLRFVHLYYILLLCRPKDFPFVHLWRHLLITLQHIFLSFSND